MRGRIRSWLRALRKITFPSVVSSRSCWLLGFRRCLRFISHRRRSPPPESSAFHRTVLLRRRLVNGSSMEHSASALTNHIANERRSCQGCCTGPALGSAMDGPSKGLRVDDREAKKQCLPENFPSSSTCEMDNSTVWSQRSMASAQSHDFPSNIGGSTDFVNSGLLLWNETRKQWIGNKISESKKQVREPKISLNATYESLLTTNRPFPETIPLAEMIEFLVDVWEQEGLYD